MVFERKGDMRSEVGGNGVAAGGSLVAGQVVRTAVAGSSPLKCVADAAQAMLLRIASQR